MGEQTIFPPFTVTAGAIDQITALGAVRLGIEPGGCCGTTYVYARTQGGPGVDSTRFGCPGAWLDVDDDALEVLRGATLDYSSRTRPPRFRVLGNPGTEEVCPCRRSFGSPWPGPRQPTCHAYTPMEWDEDYAPPSDWARRTGFTRP